MSQQRTTTAYPAASQSHSNGKPSNECSVAMLNRFVEERPDLSVCLSVGAGVAFGFVLGAALGNSEDSRRAAHRKVAESMGERLFAAIENSVPESLLKNLGLSS